MPTPRIGAGFNSCWYGVVNSSGYMIGNTAAGATAGAQAGEGMARLEGARTIPVSIPEGDTVPVSGDDEPLVQFDFESENLPSGVLEMAVRNLTFEALIQGTSVEAIGDVSVGILGPSGRAPEDMSLLLQRRSKKWSSGVRGVKAWEIILVPRCVIEPLGVDVEQRAFSPYRYKVTASKADRFAWGATFTEGLHGTTGGSIVVVESDYPVHIHAALGNNSQQVFTLPYTPKSSSKIYVYDNGVRQALTTDYTVSGADVTFVGTPASNAVLNFLYEVDEADLS